LRYRSTKLGCDRLESALKKSDFVTTVLSHDQRDQAESKAVRIATMHRAKGLEFDEIVVLLPSDVSSLGPLAANIQ
jgi:ATP-dependent exoDNAse (exonuclease V) beta subunit